MYGFICLNIKMSNKYFYLDYRKNKLAYSLTQALLIVILGVIAAFC